MIWSCKKYYKEISCKFTQFPPKLVSYKTIQCHNQDIYTQFEKQFYCYKDTSCCPFMLPLSFHPCPSLNPGNYEFVFHFYILVISRKLYKWNHIIRKFLDQLLKFSIIPSRYIQVSEYTSSSFLLLSIIP